MSMCTHPLDAQARGSMCSACWLRYVRASFDSQEEIQRIRTHIRAIEGTSVWYLPDDATLAASHEPEVTQLVLF